MISLATLKKVEKLTYDDLLADHLKDYQLLFQRVSLSLSPPRAHCEEKEGSGPKVVDDGEPGVDYYNRTIEGQLRTDSKIGHEDVSAEKRSCRGERSGDGEAEAKLSTSDRVERFKDDQDPRMVTLLFQFGRYLMLASSRPGTFVANLQGIWNNNLNPPWRSFSFPPMV